jgi:hypothetical protein
MSESAGSSEFLLGLEEYLKYLKEDTTADEVHSFAKSLQADDKVVQLIKSYLQYMIPNLPIELIELADMNHGFNKTTNPSEEVYKTLLTYCNRFLKKVDQDQYLSSLADFCHNVRIAKDQKEIYKSLLAYCAKVIKMTTDEQELDSLADLCHSINKHEEVTEDVYKAILLYNTNFIKSRAITQPEQEQNMLVDLASLCHNTRTAADIKDIYKALLLHNTNILKTKGLDELGIETGKLLRSMDQDDFDEFIVKTRLAKLDKQFPSDKIFRGIMSYLKLNLDSNALKDAFSRSQIKSKIWLIEELAKIDTNHDNVIVMAGWFGQLKSVYDKRLTYAKMRIIEMDRNACETSDYVFNLSNLENYKVKAVNGNINELTLHKNGYEWNVENLKEKTGYSEKFLPNLIINTSAEHMTEEWFNQIRFKEMESNPIVAIQSNNLFDIPEHINCVHSVDHMKKKFPMKEILFEGELQLKGYKRVMLIGRP